MERSSRARVVRRGIFQPLSRAISSDKFLHAFSPKTIPIERIPHRKTIRRHQRNVYSSSSSSSDSGSSSDDMRRIHIEDYNRTGSFFFVFPETDHVNFRREIPLESVRRFELQMRAHCNVGFYAPHLPCGRPELIRIKRVTSHYCRKSHTYETYLFITQVFVLNAREQFFIWHFSKPIFFFFFIEFNFKMVQYFKTIILL